MHREDIALFSAMQTIRLREHLVHHKTKFRHESEFVAHIRAEMKRLLEKKSLHKTTFKYFNDVLSPNTNGFSGRWSRRFQRYLEICGLATVCREKTHLERLQMFLSAMNKLGFAIQTGHSEHLEFQPAEAERVKSRGFVGLAATELAKIENGQLHENTYLTYYIGELPEAEFILSRNLQSLGFNFYFDLNNTSGRLDRGAFAFIMLVSFAEVLLGKKVEIRKSDKK